MTTTKSDTDQSASASELISNRIAELADWRGETFGLMRKLIKEADAQVVERCKWMRTPVWSHDGIICTDETYKQVVKLTFGKGASLHDPTRLFNASLEGTVRRAIDSRDGEQIDASAFQELVREAIEINHVAKSKNAKRPKTRVVAQDCAITGSESRCNPFMSRGRCGAAMPAQIGNEEIGAEHQQRGLMGWKLPAFARKRRTPRDRGCPASAC